MSSASPGLDAASAPARQTWTFLTNHAHVLVCIAQDPSVRLRDVAQRVGITERAAQSIVADLVEGGFLTRQRVGRRNHYEVHPDQPLRHPVEAHRSVGGLLAFVQHGGATATDPVPPPAAPPRPARHPRRRT